MNSIYLDHAATTPVRPEVSQAMAPYLDEVFGNPSSMHRWGRKAADALEQARTRAAAALHVERNDVYFVRGGTESDNLAIQGRAQWAREQGRAPLIATSAIEHAAVLEAAREATRTDGETLSIPVNEDAELDENALEEALARGADLVSIMWVNNEIGLHLPVPDVAAKAAERGVCVHTDAVQAIGKVPIRMGDTAVGLATLTGHKIYGPKSTGLLYRRRGVELSPLVHGGGQERGVRSGTQDVAGAVGMATALELIVAEQETESLRLGEMKAEMLACLSDGIDDLRVHGKPSACAPHVLNVGVPGVDRDALLIELDIAGIAASAGSACSSGASAASHVLTALYGGGLEGPSLRFSFGKLNDLDNTREAARRVVEVVARVRSYASR